MRKLVVTAVMALSAVWSPTAHSRPASWPGLWGPSRNGESAAGPTSLAPANELWRRKSAGGYAEVAVADGRAITMELREGSDFVVALDAATGRERWAVRVGQTYKGHDGSADGPIATPAIDGDLVFAAGPHGMLVALDAATGAERWRHDLVREFGAKVPAYGFAASPLVENGLVVIATGGPDSRGLLAFERATGRLAWNTAHAKAVGYSSPVLATLAGTRQVVAPICWCSDRHRASCAWSAPRRMVRRVVAHAGLHPGSDVRDRARDRGRENLPAKPAGDCCVPSGSVT